MKKFLLITLSIIIVSALILGGCAAPTPTPAPAPTPTPAPAPTPTPAPAPTPPKPIELRFAHQAPPSSTSHTNVWVPWTKKIEELTKGRVKITIYPSETLCKQSESIEAVKAGLADITWVVVGSFPGRFPLTTVTSIPFLNTPSGTVDGRTLTLGGIDSHILQELYETFPEIQAEWSDVKMLFLFTTDPSGLFTAKKPVRNQADLKGMKIRTLGGPPMDMFKLLGASPLSIGMPDIYPSLEKGVIEGCSLSWGSVVSRRLQEVLRYHSDVNLDVALFGLVMNKERWNGLPPDIQKAIMSVSGMYGAEFAGETEWGSGAVKRQRAGIKGSAYELEEVSLDPGEVERWIEIAGKPLWDKWVAETKAKGLPGQKVLDEALRLIEKYK